MKVIKGQLRVARGKRISLTAHPRATAAEILASAVQKHLACDSSLIDTRYQLLYPDGRIVEFIPGTRDPFALKSYKDFMGKPYSKLVFFICSDEDYNLGVLKKIFLFFGIFLYCCYISCVA